MAKRRLTTGVLVAIGVAALAGCGSSAAKPPASGGGLQTPTSVTPVTNSGGGGYGY